MNSEKTLWPRAIIAFFSVVLAINGFFIIKSITSFDGLVEDNYYEKGLKYDETIRRNQRLGWDIELYFTGINTGAQNIAKVVILDSKGKPVEGASVHITLKRPATSRYDRDFGLVSSGYAYHGAVTVPAIGIWDFAVRAERGSDRLEKTFRVRAKADGSSAKI